MDLRTSRKITWTVTIVVVILVCSMIGLNFFMSSAMGPLKSLETQRVIINQGMDSETLYEAEVAEGAALSIGLMNRAEAPGPYQGMLFDWGNAEENRSMTMYNTRFPLKVIWLDEDFNSVGAEEMSPCPTWRLFFCPEYTSPEPVRYALEVAN